MTQVAIAPANDRLRSLDGMRGLAAVVVVFTHLNGVSAPYTLPAHPHGFDEWASFSFQQGLLNSGTLAVYVFFILSGIAITLPAIKAPTYDWVAYFPRRLTRLYVPSIASLLLGVILVLAIPRNPAMVFSNGWLSQSGATTFIPVALIQQMTLQEGAVSLNGPLWSLSWEVLFSLVLPFFVAIALLIKRLWPLAIAGCLVALIIGNYADLPILSFMPMFLIGVIVAVRMGVIREWAARVYGSRWGALVTVGAILFALALLLSRDYLPLTLQRYGTVTATTGMFWLAGCLILVLLGILWPTGVRLLEMRVPQWLGRISFSLYLVHFPILVTIAYIFGERNWLLVAVVALPVIFICAYLFYRFVENPSVRLSHRVGDWAARHRQQQLEPAATRDVAE